MSELQQKEGEETSEFLQEQTEITDGDREVVVKNFVSGRFQS